MYKSNAYENKGVVSKISIHISLQIRVTTVAVVTYHFQGNNDHCCYSTETQSVEHDK